MTPEKVQDAETAAAKELRDCPFCGGEAKKRWCLIHCTKCWAQMQDPHGDEKSHVEMWNRRAATLLESRQEDAARYRWLRRHVLFISEPLFPRLHGVTDMPTLDAAIDAAIAARKEWS